MDEFGTSRGRASLRLSKPLIRAALLGQFTSAEFSGVYRQVAGDAEVLAFDTPSSLVEGVGGDSSVELVLIAQARPGDWQGPWIDELRRRAPLVRIVTVAGTWCEGETRTGRPLTADLRIYWHEFPAWWARQSEARRAGRTPAWSSPDPLCGGVAAAIGIPDAGTTTGGLAIVAAADRDSAESIAVALRVGGWSSVWVRPPRQLPDVYGASALIYDGGQLDADQLSALSHLRERYGAIPVVALADFPTVDRAAAARADGPTIVLGKPFLIEDLLWAVEIALTVEDYRPVAARCQRAG